MPTNTPQIREIEIAYVHNVLHWEDNLHDESKDPPRLITSLEQ